MWIFKSDELRAAKSLVYERFRSLDILENDADRCTTENRSDLMAICCLQTTQHTSGVAVTADSSCCANCVEPSRPQQ